MKLYIYDHCPYCVKARMIFGIKKYPLSLVYVLNDDVETPTRMIGKKMVPILQKDDGTYMPESMDIVRYIDAHDGHPVIAPQHSNGSIAQWIENARIYLSPLAMPRWARAPLKEFSTPEARAYFIEKKEAAIGSFDTHRLHSATLIAQADAHLKILESLLYSSSSAYESLSEDDIHLFASLRSLSIVRGITYPPLVNAYRTHFSELTNIPLHDAIAL